MTGGEFEGGDAGTRGAIATTWPDMDVDTGLARWARVLRVLSALAGGMRYLHSQGIVHGDLNPSNVLFKVCDHAIKRNQACIINQ